MKVFVVTAFDAEPYSSITWVDSVWDSFEKAEEHIKANPGIIDYSSENGSEGYYLSSFISEMVVQ